VSAERKPLEWQVAERPAMSVVGHSVRTTNADEADPGRARIPRLWDQVRADGLAAVVPDAVDPETLIAVLFGYESDYRGAYTELIGVEVASLTEVPNTMAGIAVPAGRYAEIAIEGPLPYALIAAWQQVWEAEDAGRLRRAYEFDYELHRNGAASLYLSLAA
jgi:predicted transcriptional regulator YdeE